MSFLKKMFGGASKPTPILQCRECGSIHFINELGELWCAGCGLSSPVKPASPPKKEPVTAPTGSSSTPVTTGLVHYRGLTFGVDGGYSLVWDDKKIVRGIWYRDRSSIKNAARNRMVVAAASTNGFTVLDSDYETTIVGGLGGVEDLQNPGGVILWFDSTRELFGK
jgi:hypothetical protein